MHENHKQAARYPINEATPIPLGDWYCIEPILFTLLNQINLAASNKGFQNKIKYKKWGNSLESAQGTKRRELGKKVSF